MRGGADVVAAARDAVAEATGMAESAALYVLEPEPDCCPDCLGSRVCRECDGSGMRPRVRRANAYETLRKVVADAAALSRAKGDDEVADLLTDAIAGF